MLERRFFLAGLAALPLAAAPATAGTTPAPDETFALIEQHRATHAALNALPGDIEGDEPESAADEAAMMALVEREPTTLAGLRAFSEYFDAIAERTLNEATPAALATIAEACRRLIPAGA